MVPSFVIFLLLVKFVINTVVKVCVVVDLVLLVNVTYSRPKFDDAGRLYESFDAVRELYRGLFLSLDWLSEIAFGAIEGSKDDALGLTVLEEGVLSRV